MSPSQPHYLPLALPLFLFLAGVFLFVVVLIQIRVLHYAYAMLGLSSNAALLILLACLAGSYFNIPIAQMPEQRFVSGQTVSIFGMNYIVPVVVDWPGTIIAVNVGGAVIPGLLSLYLLLQKRIWISGAVTTTGVALACYLLARPVAGLGIAIPIFAPPLITAAMAMLIARTNVAAVAYVSGSLGTLIGGDVLNLGRIQGLGAPIASIGGAGTFDGVFLTGILAVFLASLWGERA